MARRSSRTRRSTDAQHLLALANDRYSGGLVAYLDVITAQQSLLTSERQDVQIHGQQMTLSVSLVKALGGGWDAAGTDMSGTQRPGDTTNAMSTTDTKEAMAPAK